MKNRHTWTKLDLGNKYVIQDGNASGTQQRGGMHLCQTELELQQTSPL